MGEKLLQINNIHAEADGKEILKGLDLTVGKGEIHIVMGPNGAGKSTLMNVIMGHPKYKITNGNINFEGEDITDLKTDERARKGIFLSFQNPEEVAGITASDLIRSARTQAEGKPIKLMAFRKELKEKMALLEMNESYSERDLNVGFSGGEKKKNEILQMLMLNPKLAILDETDSGLDVDAVKIVSEGISKFKNENNSLLIITHNSKILESLKPDFVHVLLDGKIVKDGDISLMNEINTKGFVDFKKMV
ncbi:Fe-S cluster assembly ATP-binding protein [Clostridium acetobutylicum]|uniref:Iron-regulated ABC transporter ATPase subunit (SufC), VEG296 B.subtilis ortholog n=1 Tax=Clostridium acetobutylicum (strain ATCC 824 / DSM 792 / JCM 1419 / IAM 19013 / LMG 5710 / NBRC 13948 / NRRL B-527 / VKM B-1787 / 2291 / W) TaxID=272562 RepID=Q97E28_CLOAB|nr:MULTISPECIES: Fe-S cluster assembly ATPase SufC [Clostridium]AAK81222.1 Iron-regulated ABC transporter ATPase subunit (SufC), VEG296 B.subtilis ortholog [Clostridium acetobutylicum ATCC 824]ADZ22327.1 Iron-regulated ABC transporter ATPase subunit (SufC) [Clostridium acetobutylicum EA 2018]AEI33543.1 Iron-regulated ABC transporter ATPase [Clostridium acetobutylicum DSM 1731]AWV81110.1 Fe-S cluster assembly ATPase SufC [Clostridium acetobutylicum]KHD34332.1 ABC transporter ATP-binding protein